MFKRFEIATCIVLTCATLMGCSERSEPVLVAPNPKIDATTSDSRQTATDESLSPPAQAAESANAVPNVKATVQILAPVPVPTHESPVGLSAHSDRLYAKPGEIVQLIVRGRILSNWHIYSADGPSGVSFPTRFELKLPDGIEKHGKWLYPRAKVEVSTFGPISKYVDEFQATVDLKLADSMSDGSIEVECSVQYQACNLNQCLQPKTIWLRVPIQISKGEIK